MVYLRYIGSSLEIVTSLVVGVGRQDVFVTNAGIRRRDRDKKSATAFSATSEPGSMQERRPGLVASHRNINHNLAIIYIISQSYSCLKVVFF